VSKTISIAGVCLVIGLVLGGIAYAAIPDSDGVIHGCYGNSNGQLRVIDEGHTCKNNETALDWNNQGAQGDPGEPGTGISNVYTRQSEATPLSAGAIDNASATCDPGDLLLGGGYSTNNSGDVFASDSRSALSSWFVVATNTSTSDNRFVVAVAQCADITP
jgi:hypothetical protein